MSVNKCPEYSFNIEYPEYPECFLDGIDLKLYYIFAI